MPTYSECYKFVLTKGHKCYSHDKIMKTDIIHANKAVGKNLNHSLKMQYNSRKEISSGQWRRKTDTRKK